MSIRVTFCLFDDGKEVWDPAFGQWVVVAR